MRAIINLSTAKFKKGQERLIKSLKKKTNADIFLYTAEQQVKAPFHSKNNYAFKVYAIEAAIKKGYKTILWLDASLFVIKNLDPLFKIIEEKGYFFQDGGYKNNQWTNQKAKEYFGTDEGDMMAACVIGLNLEDKRTRKFFRLWKKSMKDGQFNGSWDDFRHDQTCASLIAYKLDMPLFKMNSIFEYGLAEKEPSHENILMIADGIC